MNIVSTLFQYTSQGVTGAMRLVGIGNTSEAAQRQSAEEEAAADMLFEPVLEQDESTHLLLNNNNNSATVEQRGSLDTIEQQHQERSLTADYEEFSHSTRAVRLCLFHIVIYYSLAVAGFSFLVEKWSVTDSLFFATVLCTTIGYGDIAPDQPSGRIYTACLCLYGVVMLGIFLGVLGQYVVEEHDLAAEERRKKVSSQVVQFLKDENSNTTVEAAEVQPEDVFTESVRDDVRERSLWEDIWSLVMYEAPIMGFLVLTSLGIGYLEGWSWMESLYWLVISGTTVGFGDFHPSLSYTKLFSCFFLPLAVAVLGALLGRIASLYMDRKRRLAEQRFLSRSLTLCDLTTMDTSEDGRVDKAEFLTYMLTALQKVSKEDVQEIVDLFHKLDVDGSNYLSKDDLEAKNLDESLRSSLCKSLKKEQ
jgi:Ion channel